MSNQPILMMMQAAPSGQSGGTMAFLIQMFPLLAVFVIFYLIVMRPQSRRMKEHQNASAAGKKGDEVVTGGGSRGKVTKVIDEEAEGEIAQGVKIRVIKATISQVLTANTKPAND